jgi:alpha-ketoglutarate-dependent 2,4-dichlorophenoxyacetate dioxygenase
MEMRMSIVIRAIQGDFVGEVTGIDIRHPLPPQAVQAIEEGMDRYAALVFRGQYITDEQQMAFTLHFGRLQNGSNSTTQSKELRLDPAFADVSNVDKSGRLLDRDDRRRASSLGNRLWHSDASFRPIPARYSLLSARVVPPTGGNTELADMRAAYDGLDPSGQAEVEDMICGHSQIHSRAQLGFTEYTLDERSTMQPALQRLVRTHPVTGRKSLFLSAHIGSIEGWPRPEAMAFIRDLMEHATQRKYVYAHRWTAGDLLMWDNRATMHRVRRFDDLTHRRDLRRTTTVGEPTLAVNESTLDRTSAAVAI